MSISGVCVVMVLWPNYLMDLRRRKGARDAGPLSIRLSKIVRGGSIKDSCSWHLVVVFCAMRDEDA